MAQIVLYITDYLQHNVNAMVKIIKAVEIRAIIQLCKKHKYLCDTFVLLVEREDWKLSVLCTIRNARKEDTSKCLKLVASK